MPLRMRSVRHRGIMAARFRIPGSLRRPPRRDAVESDLDDELRAYVDLLTLREGPVRNGLGRSAARCADRPAPLADPIRRELHDLDPNVVVRFETLADRIRESLVIERGIAIISGFLGTVALLLASAGLYGLLAYTVSRRTAEIGIRIALGASQTGVKWLVLKDYLLLVAVGSAAGLGAALALGGFAEKLLYRLTARDPFALGAACLLVLAVTFAAAFIPAHRAARVDPMIALRHE